METTQVHAFADDALGAHDAVGLVELLHSGEVSAPELVDAALARVGSVDPTLRAVAAYDSARARERARDLRPGFFSGVPTMLKENVSALGLPLQNGTDAYTAKPATQDGDVARLFSGLGAVVLGSTRMSEFGFSAACDHPRRGSVRSPWSIDHTAGASSAGAGALVAAGALPFAHGNDGGGSIRIPAAVNGLVGLKPTRGRTPSDPLSRSMPVRLVADGVLTRSVRDTAAFLRESERIYRDPALPQVGDVRRPLDRQLRIAVMTTGIGRDCSPEMERLTLTTAARMEALGHHVERIDPPVPGKFADAFLDYWGLLATAVTRQGPKDHSDWDASKLDNLTLGLAERGRRRLWAMPANIAALKSAKGLFAKFYDDYDVLLTPTLATVTPLAGHLDPSAEFEQVLERLMEWVAFTPLQNVSGDPAISLPLAVAEAGTPVGMQFAARYGNDALLLELAWQIEEAATDGGWGFSRLGA